MDALPVRPAMRDGGDHALQQVAAIRDAPSAPVESDNPAHLDRRLFLCGTATAPFRAVQVSNQPVRFWY
jgi:hypothetical protein